MERTERPFNGLSFLHDKYIGQYCEVYHKVQYTNLLAAQMPGLCNEGFAVLSLPETSSVNDDNERDIKCNDDSQRGLLVENQNHVDLLLDPSCSSADTR
jgi:hypothetical protein